MSDKVIQWEYPDQLHDEHGYPTNDALDYIKNWSLIYGQTRETSKKGHKWGQQSHDELIEYIKGLWWGGDDAIVYEDGLLELHTYGWSGNEEIIEELRSTDLWMFKFRAKMSGGHYYFKLHDEMSPDWWVVKSKD